MKYLFQMSSMNKDAKQSKTDMASMKWENN